MDSTLFNAIAFLPAVTAFILVFISIPAVIRIAYYFGLLDNPSFRPHPAHTETRIIPRAGGLAIFLGILATILIYIPLSKALVGIITGAGLLVFIGLIDDQKDVPPYIRLIINLIAASLVVFGGTAIPFITNPFGPIPIHFDQIRITFLGDHSILLFADILAIIWIVWTTNIVGWSGGVDGQMPGFVAIAAFFIGLLSFNQITPDNFPIWTGTTLTFIVCGAYLGFLPWNFYPQKIMPGYAGKSLAGFMLAIVAILNSAKLGTAILVLGIPIIDAIYVLLTRMLTKRNPTLGSRSHLHHRLLDAGWSKRKIALFYWSVSAILGFVALHINAKQKLFVVMFLFVCVAGFILWLKHYFTSLKKSDQDNGLKI